MRKVFHPTIGALFLLIILCSGVSAKMPLGEKITNEPLNVQNKGSMSSNYGGSFNVFMNVAPALQADVGQDYIFDNPNMNVAWKESEQGKQVCATTMKTLKSVSGPLGLTATAASETQINLSWNPVNGALGYKVYRDGLYLITSTATTSVPDKELREAGRYCYQVTAVDSAGKESEPSNQACAEAIEQKFAEKKVEAATSGAKDIIEKGRIRIDIEFDNNKYDVEPRYHQELKEIGDVLAANPELKMVIEGHTDNVGSKGYNMNLSTRRAEAVRLYIIEHFDVKKTHLTAKGYGMSKPIASNKTAAGRQKNRRVEAAEEYVIKK